MNTIGSCPTTKTSLIARRLESLGVSPELRSNHKIFISQIANELEIEHSVHIEPSTVKKVALRMGFVTASKKEGMLLNESDENKLIKAHLLRLKDSLMLEEKEPTEYIIYPREILKELKIDPPVNYVRYVQDRAKEFGFRVANVHEANIRAQETDDSKRIREYFSDLKLELRKKRIALSKYIVYPKEIWEKLGLDPKVHKNNISRVARDMGFRTATKSEALIRERENERTRSIRQYFRNLIPTLKYLNIETKDHLVYSMVVARKLGFEDSQMVRGIARREFGFKTANVSESQIIAHQTLHSQIIRGYLNTLKGNILAKKGKLIGEVIYPAKIARALSTKELVINSSYLAEIARDMGFEIPSRSEAHRRFYFELQNEPEEPNLVKVPKPQTWSMYNKDGDFIANEDLRTLEPIEMLIQEEEDLYDVPEFNRMDIALCELKEELPLAYQLISMHFGLNTEESNLTGKGLSVERVAELLNKDVSEVRLVLFTAMDLLRSKMVD